MANAENDIVKHPAHYCYGKYEPKDDIIQDLKKAKQFLEFEIEALENERK